MSLSSKKTARPTRENFINQTEHYRYSQFEKHPGVERKEPSEEEKEETDEKEDKYEKELKEEDDSISPKKVPIPPGENETIIREAKTKIPEADVEETKEEGDGVGFFTSITIPPE